MTRTRSRGEAILFADVGDEKHPTYDYLPIIQRYLAAHNFPAVQVVKYAPRHGQYSTLEENCLVNKTLPSLAFGYKSCSLKWKRQPQDKWMRRFQPTIVAWAMGQKVIKAIGYDAGPKDARRQHILDDKEYQYWYPLQDWGWDRERCKLEIAHAGLPVPVKSACFHCPATKPQELHHLDQDYLRRIVRLEENAKPNLTKIEGLWRSRRKRDNRPGAMTEYIYREGLLELPELAGEAEEVAGCIGGCYC